MTAPRQRTERVILRAGSGRDRDWLIVVRQVDDIEFPGDPFWVDAEELGKFRTRDDARDFMIARTARAARSGSPASESEA